MREFRVADNRMIQVDGHDFLFLTADKAIFEVDPATRDALSRWSEKAVLTEDDVYAELSGSVEDKQELVTELVKRCVVVPANGNRPEPGPTRGTIPMKTLVFHVTDRCNLGCTYCYRSCGGTSERKDQSMSPEVARKAVDFLIEHSGDQEDLVLVLFGGEPLLNFKLIQSIISYARSRAEERGKKIDFPITTNGTLLNPDIVRFLVDNNIGVTVSIDGFEEIQDRYRPFPDGSPSYRVILPKVKNLLQASRRRPVVARVTVAEDPTEVPRILDHLLGLGFIEAGFSPVTAGETDHQISPEGMNRLLSQFQELTDRFIDAARREQFYGFSNIIDLLVQLHQGEVMNYPCGAGLGLFSVAPDGRLYICQRFTGEDEFCMGDIFTGFDQGRLTQFREQAAVSNKDECKTCWVRTVCTGGCYHEACVREGSYLKPNLHYCEWIKRWVEIGLKAYGTIAISCPDYLEKLSMSRGHSSMLNQ